MALAQADRIAFSLSIVNTDPQIAGLATAKAALLAQQSAIQAVDTGNMNLATPSNTLINAYQLEIAQLDGNVRTTIVEQDIQDAAAKKIQNHFFPNDTTATVPSIASLRNIWPRTSPYALNYAIGKNYIEGYNSTVTTEASILNNALSLITAAASNLDIENTSGQHVATAAGTCSLPSYTTQPTCVSGGGVWTPGVSDIETYAAVVTLKNNLVSAINSLVSFLNAEVLLIPTTDTPNQTQNQAAIDNINTVILPALTAWLANPDFNPVPGTVTPASFNSYSATLLAPTKLYSGQLTLLRTALNNRLTFTTTRLGQLNTILGGITQDITTGNVTGSGLYLKRYNLITLRLNALSGSLTQLASLSTAANAQTSIVASLTSTKATYQSIIPTTMLKSNASNSRIIHVVDPSFIFQGDSVFIYAETQEELVRGVVSVQGDMVTLSDVVPAKYTTSIKARLYKDLS